MRSTLLRPVTILVMAAVIALVTGTLGAIGVKYFYPPSSPAQAAICSDGACTVLDHTSDSGYDDPITVKCADGRAVNVPEGSASNGPNGCVDVKQVYIHSAPIEEVRCFRNSAWYTLANTPGWHNVTNWSGYRNCVNQIRSDGV